MITGRAFGPAELTGAHWHKSTYSANSGACVEIADLANCGQAVRDSKDPAGPTLTFTAAQWVAFTSGVRSGDFD
ncbi:MAG: DUF397 domain-containing protein [Pseudonocardiaceae bacterium]